MTFAANISLEDEFLFLVGGAGGGLGNGVIDPPAWALSIVAVLLKPGFDPA